jgi:hypothetical protein
MSWSRRLPLQPELPLLELPLPELELPVPELLLELPLPDELPLEELPLLAPALSPLLPEGAPLLDAPVVTPLLPEDELPAPLEPSAVEWLPLALPLLPAAVEELEPPSAPPGPDEQARGPQATTIARSRDFIGSSPFERKKKGASDSNRRG